MVLYKKLTASLQSGTNIHTFTDTIINDGTIVEAYTTDYTVYFTNISQSGNTITVTVSDHINPVGICVTVSNVEIYEPIDVGGITSDITTLKAEMLSAQGDISSLDGEVGNINTTLEGMAGDIESLGSLKQDKLTAGDNITITNNTISATDTVTEVIDSFDSTSTTAALSANKGRDLKESLSQLTVETNTISVDGVMQSGFVNTSGTVVESSSYWHTQKIEVYTDDVVEATYSGSSSTFRFVCAYDSNNNAISSKGVDGFSSSYTVPRGVRYVVLTFQTAHSIVIKVTRQGLTDKTLSLSGKVADSQIVGDSITDLKQSLTTLSESRKWRKIKDHVLASTIMKADLDIANNTEIAIHFHIGGDWYAPIRVIPLTDLMTNYTRFWESNPRNETYVEALFNPSQSTPLQIVIAKSESNDVTTTTTVSIYVR